VVIEFKDIQSDDFSRHMPLRYYPRAMRIKFKKEFVTPMRAVIDSEYIKKMDFPNQIKLEDYVSIKVKYFNEDDFSSFLRKNGAMKKLSEDIGNFMKSSTDSYLSMLSLRPLYSSIWPNLNQRQFESFMRFLNVAEGGLTTRSLPNIPIDIEYKTVVNEFCKQYEEYNPVIWLDLKEDPGAFEKRIDVLKLLINEGRLQMLGFNAERFGTAEDYNVNLDYMYSNLMDKEILLIYEGSNKSFTKRHEGLSKIHYHPFEVFDVISPYRFPRGGNNKKLSQLEKINKATFLDPDNVALMPFDSLGEEKIKKYIDKRSKSFIEDIVSKKENSETINDTEVKSFRSFADIQQVVAGEREMVNISNSIKKQETFNYLESKENVEVAVKKRLSNSQLF